MIIKVKAHEAGIADIEEAKLLVEGLAEKFPRMAKVLGRLYLLASHRIAKSYVRPGIASGQALMATENLVAERGRTYSKARKGVIIGNNF